MVPRTSEIGRNQGLAVPIRAAMFSPKQFGTTAPKKSNAKFEQARARFTIGSLDATPLHAYDVVAQYNPKELQFERAVPWHDHEDNGLEFGGWQGRTTTVELFFDGVEKGVSIAKPLANLETLATVIDPNAKQAEKLRPHKCVACLGDRDDVPRLTCVIESLTVKYLVFAADGTPLRASATVKLKEATVITRKGK